MSQRKPGVQQRRDAVSTARQQPGNAQRHKPDIVQPKTAPAARLNKQPAAPPMYRPQAGPKAVQPQMPPAAKQPRLPAIPPIYRPQPVPKVLQTKTASVQPSHSPQSPRRTPSPPAYRPQPVPRVLQAKESLTSTRTSPATIQPSGLSPAHRTPAHQLVKATPSRFGNTIQLGKKKSRQQVAIDRQKRQSEDGDAIAWTTIKTNWATMQADDDYPFTLKKGEPGVGGGQYFFEFSKDGYSGHVSVPGEETKCFHLTLTAPKKDKGNYYFYFKGRAVKSADPKTKSSYGFSQLPSDFKDDATTLVRDLFL